VLSVLNRLFFLSGLVSLVSSSVTPLLHIMVSSACVEAFKSVSYIFSLILLQILFIIILNNTGDSTHLCLCSTLLSTMVTALYL
jgi:hypothetical protein